MTEQPSVVCELCGADLHSRSWVLLNRYVIRGTRNPVWVESRCPVTDQCEWEMEKEPRAASGVMLCLDPCLLTWLQGDAIEADMGIYDDESDPTS